MFISRMETLVEETSGDVIQVTGTAETISQRVDRIDDKFQELDRKPTEAVPITELTNALDDLAELRAVQDASDQSLDASTQKEIDYLLEQISPSTLNFAYSGKTRKALSFRVLLYTNIPGLSEVWSPRPRISSARSPRRRPEATPTT
jgi:hypothetical protein